ncbi:hypothetical protein C6376_27500 [Streptomyces sp. P3]|nr:hypothetical protein C6376_27500 [Streptomyces sp. P3]
MPLPLQLLGVARSPVGGADRCAHRFSWCGPESVGLWAPGPVRSAPVPGRGIQERPRSRFVPWTAREVRAVRPHGTARWAGLTTVGIAPVFLLWTQTDTGNARSLTALAVTVLALLGALAANRRAREGWAFVLSGVTVAAAVAMLFLALYPDVMPSSLDTAWSLTVSNASSSAYTLKVMTWVAAIMTPLVLLYQSWTYWVFRKRIGVEHIPA